MAHCAGNAGETDEGWRMLLTRRLWVAAAAVVTCVAQLVLMGGVPTLSGRSSEAHDRVAK